MDRRRTAGIMIERETYRMLCKLSMIRKGFFCDPTASISDIINDALTEYFENHNEEITKLLAEYHKQGGCAEL